MTTEDTQKTLREEDLRQFTGTERYYKTGIPWHPFVYTDGVHYVVNYGEAFWMLDVIGSWQTDPKIKNDKMLQDMQFWTLEKDTRSSRAVMRCERDKNKVVIEQKISYTDFPLPSIRFYLAHMWCFWKANSMEGMDDYDDDVIRPSTGVLLLPSEY